MKQTIVCDLQSKRVAEMVVEKQKDSLAVKNND